MVTIRITDKNGKVDYITIKIEMLKNTMQTLRHIYGFKVEELQQA